MKKQSLPLVLLEDEPIHTEERPLCDDPACPCHDSIAEILKQPLVGTGGSPIIYTLGYRQANAEEQLMQLAAHMKLSDDAKQQGVRYETAWRWFRDGKIKGRRVGAHTILIEEEHPSPAASSGQVAVYTRVSSAENKANLNRQAERLVAYCAVRGYQISKVVKEIGSGVNDNRPKFLALLADASMGRIVIAHQDRGTRFGFRYIETLLNAYGREIEVVNQAENSTKDLLADLTSIIYSFCARLYGQRRAKRKTEKIVQELEAKDATG